MNKTTFSLLSRWSIRFTLLQCFVFYLTCVSYVWNLFPLYVPFLHGHSKQALTAFIFLTYFGHFALLACAFILVPCLVVAAITRRIIPVTVVGWLAASISVAFFLIDAKLYSTYRTHVNSVYLEMAFSGHADDLLNLSQLEWTILFVGALIVAAVQALLAKLIWRWNDHPMSTGPWLSCLLALLWISYAINFNTISHKRNETLIQTKAFPFYQKVLLIILPGNKGQLRNTGSGFFTQAKQVDAPVQYPIHPMNCKQRKNPPNILFIVIDTWRPDSVTPKIMPTISALRKNTQDFPDHLSGGNGTKPGMFSLFYSISSVYYESMLKYRQPTVLLQELKKQGYDIGIFVSAPPKMPNFQDTLYLDADVLYAPTYSKDASIRDQKVTLALQNFLNLKHQKPFFAMAFFDIAHAYCETPVLNTPFTDAVQTCNRLSLNNKSDPTPYLHRYYNTVHFADNEVKKVLDTLKKQGLDKNTIVVFTGDHSQEFNDNKHNYWEHANNFTDIQVKTPFMISWPGKSPKKIDYRTSHYDVVPTLMQEIFSCNNPPADYSMGSNLFDPKPKRDALLIGSYINNAIVEPNKITILWMEGDIEVQAKDAKTLPNEKPDIDKIRQALYEMRRFYKSEQKN